MKYLNSVVEKLVPDAGCIDTHIITAMTILLEKFVAVRVTVFYPDIACDNYLDVLAVVSKKDFKQVITLHRTWQCYDEIEMYAKFDSQPTRQETIDMVGDAFGISNDIVHEELKSLGKIDLRKENRDLSA